MRWWLELKHSKVLVIATQEYMLNILIITDVKRTEVECHTFKQVKGIKKEEENYINPINERKSSKEKSRQIEWTK